MTNRDRNFVRSMQQRKVIVAVNQGRPDEWEEVGLVGVDSGHVWIGDPCYVILDPDDARPAEFGSAFDDLVGQMTSEDAVQWSFDQGHPGLGVSVRSGFGDGGYPVYVKRTKTGEVAAVLVQFIEEDEEG